MGEERRNFITVPQNKKEPPCYAGRLLTDVLESERW